MKKFLALLLCLSLTACTNSNSYFNEVNPYFEETFDEQNMNHDELKEYQSDYYNSDDADELEKNFYNTAVLNDYNTSPKDPLFMKYSEYQMYTIGEEFSLPNQNLVKGSPTNAYGTFFNVYVNDISIYNTVFDAGYSEADIKNIPQLNNDGTTKNGFDLVGVNIEIKGNGTLNGFDFDFIYSTDPEKESVKNTSALVIFETDDKGTIIIKNEEPKNLHLWFLVDTSQYDYDNLYFCVGATDFNMEKSFISLSDILGDGESKSTNSIQKLDKHFNSDNIDENSKKYYELIKNDIANSEESPITIDNCKYQVYSGENVEMTYPFDAILQSDPEYYEYNSIDISVKGLYIYDSLLDLYGEFFYEQYDYVKEHSDTLDPNTSTHFKKQLTMYNENGDFLDKNGEISDSHKLILFVADIYSHILKPFTVSNRNSLELYYIPNNKSNAVLLQEYMFAPTSDSSNHYVDPKYPEVPLQNIWIIDTEKYPLEDLYIAIGFFENENYKKSFIKVSDSTNETSN